MTIPPIVRQVVVPASASVGELADGQGASTEGFGDAAPHRVAECVEDRVGC